MGEADMARKRAPNILTTQLIREHSTIPPSRGSRPTIADMARATGINDLGGQLSKARREGTWPSKRIIFGIWLHLTPYGQRELLPALTVDAGYEIPDEIASGTSGVADFHKHVEQLFASFSARQRKALRSLTDDLEAMAQRSSKQ